MAFVRDAASEASVSDGGLSPILTRLLQGARAEEKQLAAIATAVAHGDRDEVFRLAAELTHNIGRPQPTNDVNSIEPIPRLLAENCGDSPASAFLES